MMMVQLGGTIQTMIQLSDVATDKIKETITGQGKDFLGIRVAVVGGGCSGFQYAMNLEHESKEGDEIIDVDGFKVFVDKQSMLYLDGTQIDYVETVEGAGFRFNNPNVTGTCGCGESFHA